MSKVTIVGAGIAGLTAALRLAERGYEVTIYERDGFVGGKFRATKWEGKRTKKVVFHEHSYHMFLNWYHNFWEIAEEIGARKSFIPLTRVHFLSKGEFPRMKELVNFGSLSSVRQNLLSGIIPVSDMLLYMYSVLDLLGTPMGQRHYRDLISVNGFAATRPYATEASVGMYDEYLAKTFAIASYQSSAKTFQTFLEYGTYSPEPLYWGLTGDCYEKFLRLLQDRIEKLGVRIKFHHEAIGIGVDGTGRVCTLKVRQLDENFHPTLSDRSSDSAIEIDWFDKKEDIPPIELDGPLILAVPHSALSRLINSDVLNRDPEFGEVDKLRGVPMASVHLHLNKGFARRLRRKLPREPVVLLNSKYKLSLVCNSSLWQGVSDTYLNIVASDSRPLGHLPRPSMFTDDRDWNNSGPELAIHTPVTALDHILHEFRRFVDFHDDEIDKELLHIDTNSGRELFINEVGSWAWRPQTRTKVQNLFLAGDFCRNGIDVVCLEGAVVSGLQAAERVRRQRGMGRAIQIIRPRRYSYAMFWPLKLALAPWAAGAKAWSTLRDIAKG